MKKDIKGIDPNKIIEAFIKEFGPKAPKMLEEYLKGSIKRKGGK